ncbi:DUF2057 family protein [Pantoea sp. 1.19]|uniref:DUF2057 family protein n=1 Tax=Pantoea sp. 1.19 TaxID=1925589 RepID=UPI0009489D72|nr:DUF2057 family protein [Pantoea sp. 1.19]
MIVRLLITGLCALLMTLNAWSSTLKLNPEIDILVLDGRKISGSLLKGAEGLELEKGEHQFLFRVEKNLLRSNGQAVKYRSAPLIVTFTATAKTVSLHLPRLTTLREGQDFSRSANFQLVDERGDMIASRRDTLRHIDSDDVEQAMLSYNRTGQKASVPRFAYPKSVSQQSGKTEVRLVNLSEEFGVRLPRWYAQIDSATRERLSRLKRSLRAG